MKKRFKPPMSESEKRRLSMESQREWEETKSELLKVASVRLLLRELKLADVGILQERISRLVADQRKHLRCEEGLLARIRKFEALMPWHRRFVYATALISVFMCSWGYWFSLSTLLFGLLFVALVLFHLKVVSDANKE